MKPLKFIKLLLEVKGKMSTKSASAAGLMLAFGAMYIMLMAGTAIIRHFW